MEVEAIRIGDDRAREEVKTIWKTDLFKETQQALIFSDLESCHGNNCRVSSVIDPRRLIHRNPSTGMGA